MKTNKLLGLAVLAIVLVVAAVWKQSQSVRARKPSAEVGSPVLAALQDAATAGAIEAVSFVSADSTVRVVRADGAWTAADRYGHPIRIDDLRKFLRSLADLKVGQAVVGGEKDLAALNLVSPARADDGSGVEGSGTLVQMTGAQGKSLATVVMGKTRSRGGEMSFPDGRFVFADGRPALVSETFNELPTKSVDWMETSLIDVFSSDLVTLAYTPAGKPSMTLTNASGSMVLTGMPTNETLDSAKSGKLTGLVSYLRFVDIADPSLKPDVTGMKSPSVVVVRARNGREYTLRIGGTSDAGQRYVSVCAVYHPDPLPDAPADDATDEVKKKHDEDVAAKKAENEKAAVEVKEFSDRASKWVYIVEGSRFEDLPLEMKDLVQPREEPESEAKPAAEPEARPAVQPATKSADKPAPKTEAKPASESVAPAKPKVAPKPAPKPPTGG